MARFIGSDLVLSRLAGWAALVVMVAIMTADLYIGRHRNFNNWFGNQAIMFDWPVHVFHDAQRDTY